MLGWPESSFPNGKEPWRIILVKNTFSFVKITMMQMWHTQIAKQRDNFGSSGLAIRKPPYLIIVSSACNGVGVLFSSRHTFFQGERNRDCFKQSLFKEKNAYSHFCVIKFIIPNTKYSISCITSSIILNHKRHQVGHSKHQYAILIKRLR